MSETFIKTENLSFSYSESSSERGTDVLKGINLEIEKGTFVAVLGHNGSGKSTFAKLLNLILRPTAGKIWIDGMDVTDPSMSEDDLFALRAKVGMVFQNPDNQMVATIVEEDIAFGPENLGVEPAVIRQRVDDALDAVGMRAYARHAPHQLSGGQKQRVAIAGVIAMRPECIIFDESTAMLDPTGRDEVMRTILALNRDQGITVIHITHNMNEAVMADRVIVMDDGSILLDGKPEEVFSQVELLKRIGLGVPQVTELFYELAKCGIDLPLSVINEEEGAKRLLALLNK